MDLFDKLKAQGSGAQGFGNNNNGVVGSSNGAPGNRSVPVIFHTPPQSYSEFTALPQAAMQNPFDTAAMFVMAMCLYPLNQAEAINMVNYLKGPQPLSPYERQFLSDRMNGKEYLPRSFFAGAVPGNSYMPSKPYTITVSENPYSYQEQGYAKLFIQSGGADSPRPIKMRQAKDGCWYLWEQFLLSEIRPPSDASPWA